MQQGPGKHHSSIHHCEIQSPAPWESLTPVMRDQKPSVFFLCGGDHHQGFLPDTTGVSSGESPFCSCSSAQSQGNVGEILWFGGGGLKISLCRVRGLLGSGAAAPGAPGAPLCVG